ncbi:MAG: ABC transporter ATP-binding protein [Deltaproteobacteria bacterium]
MNEEIAIKVENLIKLYRLYDRPVDRLKESFHPFRKRYHKEFYALNGISFEVKKGETVGIIGKNGSGKSTLLKIITGILTPTSGEVTVNGKVSALLELGAGFNPEYTGIENIYLNGTLMGYSKEEMDAKMQDIIDFADIGDFIYQRVKMYSSGMFARLAFAVAISVNPDILIVDEALSVGDIGFQAKCFAKFRSLQQEGKTIIFVTHDIEAVIKYCQSAILFKEGNIIMQGLPKEVVDLYKKLIVGTKVHSGKEYENQKNKRIQSLKNADDAKAFEISSVCEIYGNNKANIIDFGVFDENREPTQKLIFGSYYTFRMKVVFNDYIENPTFTYTIRDVGGQDVTGTNTMFQDIYTGNFDKGDIMLVTFKHKLNLNSGIYLLTFACSGFEGEKFVVYERLYHILILEVIAFKKIVGFFDLDSKILLEKIEGDR